MRKTILMLLVLTGVVTACKEDRTLDIADGSAVEFQGKNAVIRANDLSNIRFKNLPGAISLDPATPKGEIRVEASEKLDQWLVTGKAGGELRIEGKQGLPAAIDLHFYMNPLDILKIVVEGNRKVLISSTPFMDFLELVTEGESELVIHDLKVRNLKSRREGKSRMFLSSGLTGFKRDSLFFRASTVQVLDEKNLVYTEENRSYLLFAPHIKIRNDSVFALGYDTQNPLRSFFITQTHDLVNQGESLLDAFELPTLGIVSKNEGKSESRVWAVNQLSVKGEGESVMYFLGSPLITQKLEGSSRLNRLR